jgi:hypothetical protein
MLSASIVVIDASILLALSLYVKLIPECEPDVNNAAVASSASSIEIPVVVAPPAVVPLPTNICPVVVS